MELLKPAVQFGTGRSLPWSGAELVNGFAEQADGDKRTDFAVMMIPGPKPYATVGSGPIRGAVEMGGELWVVSGAQLYSLTQGGTATLRGSVASGSVPVRMAANSTQVAIVSGTTAYVWNGSLVSPDASFPAVCDVTFLDGYFIWQIAGSGGFTITQIEDGTEWDAADVATAEGAPDDTIGIIADHRELHLYGTRSVEIWYNSGDADFPFTRQGNAFIERGCFDRDSIVKIDNSVHFVGDDRVVYRLNGYTPQRISAHAIEYQIRNATWFRAWAYTQEGHKFYVLNTDVGCWAFDMATSLWHQRQSWNMTGYRIGGSYPIWNEVLWFDNVDGSIYTPDFDTYSEGSDPIAFEVTLPTIDTRNRALATFYSFEALFETGIGLESGATPVISLAVSHDGGRNFSSWMERSLGTVGQYLTRVIWRRLGKARQFQIKMRVTDSVRRFVMSYHADIR